MKQLYDTTKKLSDKFSKPERPVKNKNRNTINGTQEQLDQWAEHFENLLNSTTQTNPPDIQEVVSDLDIDCRTPSKEERKKAIKHLKNGKAAGPDNIPAEEHKANIETAAELLHPLFANMWKEEKVPTEWKKREDLRKETSATVPTAEESHWEGVQQDHP